MIISYVLRDIYQQMGLNHMATIKDIAKIVGVSTTTVSRVLNNDPEFTVSANTRMHIFQTAEKLAYKKRAPASVTHRVALLYWLTENEELEDIYYKQIRMELETKFQDYNISMRRYDKEEGIGAIDPETDAFLIVGRFEKQEFEKITSISRLGVIIDTASNDIFFDSVRPNLSLMIRQMIDHFLAQGHRKIGLICGHDYGQQKRVETLDIRENAFREYMEELGILNEKYIFRSATGSVSGGYQCALNAIEESGDDLPTAFCVASDPLAVGTLQAFHEKGIAIPQRVSFFSIDDVIVSKYVSPPLTTFHIDIPFMCQTALKLLQERLANPNMPQETILLNGTPVYRKSIQNI